MAGEEQVLGERAYCWVSIFHLCHFSVDWPHAPDRISIYQFKTFINYEHLYLFLLQMSCISVQNLFRWSRQIGNLHIEIGERFYRHERKWHYVLFNSNLRILFVLTE